LTLLNLNFCTFNVLSNNLFNKTQTPSPQPDFNFEGGQSTSKPNFLASSNILLDADVGSSYLLHVWVLNPFALKIQLIIDVKWINCSEGLFEGIAKCVLEKGLIPLLWQKLDS